MKQPVCEENKEAEEKLPPKISDNSGIGVYYIDEYIKPMNATLDNGTVVTCKRRGLKLTLGIGEKQGSGLMRRLDVSSDPREMLRAALNEAAKAAGVQFSVEDGKLYVDDKPNHSSSAP